MSTTSPTTASLNQADSATDEFSPDDIREYVGGLGNLSDDDVILSNIEVAVAVIGSHEPNDEGFDPEMVLCAAGNIISWMSDFGVTIDNGQINVG